MNKVLNLHHNDDIEKMLLKIVTRLLQSEIRETLKLDFFPFKDFHNKNNKKTY